MKLTIEKTGDPTPLVISHPDNADQEFDFLDVGVGFRHVIVLTTDERIFVIGANQNGQLGLGKEERSTENWMEVELASLRSGMATSEDEVVEVVGVAAGDNASFVMVMVKRTG